MLDDLLSTEVGRARLADLAALFPAALRDQHEAAESDAHIWLGLEASALGVDMSEVSELLSDLPGWVRLDMLSVYVAWQSGQARTCTHSPSGQRPQPVLTAAWRPGLVACARCTHLINLRPGSVPDRRCDECGRVTSGQGDDGIHPCRVQYGPMLYAFGLCGDCGASVRPKRGH